MYYRCGSNTMVYTVVLTPTVPSDTLSTVTHTITYSYILYKVNYRILSKISTVRLVLKTVVFGSGCLIFQCRIHTTNSKILKYSQRVLV